MLKLRPGIPRDASGYWSWPGCRCWLRGPGDAAPTTATQEAEGQLVQISFNRTTNEKERDLYRKHHSPSLLGKQNRTKKVIPFKEQRGEPGVLKPSNAEGPFLKTNEALRRPEFIIALSQFSPG